MAFSFFFFWLFDFSGVPATLFPEELQLVEWSRLSTFPPTCIFSWCPATPAGQLHGAHCWCTTGAHWCTLVYNYKCQTCLGSTASGHQLLFFYFAQGQELVFPWNHIITKAGEDTRSDTEASRLELLCSNVH